MELLAIAFALCSIYLLQLQLFHFDLGVCCAWRYGQHERFYYCSYYFNCASGISTWAQRLQNVNLCDCIDYHDVDE